jgi:hypothetical protein
MYDKICPGDELVVSRQWQCFCTCRNVVPDRSRLRVTLSPVAMLMRNMVCATPTDRGWLEK